MKIHGLLDLVPGQQFKTVQTITQSMRQNVANQLEGMNCLANVFMEMDGTVDIYKLETQMKSYARISQKEA